MRLPRLHDLVGDFRLLQRVLVGQGGQVHFEHLDPERRGQGAQVQLRHVGDAPIHSGVSAAERTRGRVPRVAVPARSRAGLTTRPNVLDMPGRYGPAMIEDDEGAGRTPALSRTLAL